MSLAKRIASSALSQVAAKFIIAALSVISVKFITQYLGVEGYGKYTVVYEMMAFSGIIADFGFFHIALREMGKDRENMAKILGNILSMRFLLALGASLLTFCIVFFFTDYDVDTVKLGLIIALGTSTIGLMGTTITAVIQVNLKMTYAAIFQILGKVTMIAYLWYAVHNDLGFLHMLYSGLIGTLLVLVLTYTYTIRYSKIYFAFDWIIWKNLFLETYPMGIALILYNLTLRAPILMLDRIVKEEALTGVYGVSQRITEVLIFIPVAFMNSVLPIISKLIHDGTSEAKKHLEKIIQYSFDLLNALSLPFIAGAIILSPQIITLLSKAEFTQGTHIFQILVSMIFFYYLSTLFGYILLAYNKQKLYMWANAWAAGVTLLCGIAITPFFREYGALTAHILAEIVAMVVTYMYLRRILHFRLSFRNLFRMIFASILLLGVLWLIRFFLADQGTLFLILVSMVVGGGVYFGSLILFRAIPYKEMMGLLRRGKES